jgi:hypothetical protein
MSHSRKATSLLVAAYLGLASAAQASPPVMAEVSLVPDAPRGSARELGGMIAVTNPGEVDLKASARSFSSRLGYRVVAAGDVNGDGSVVKPRQTAYLPFKVSFKGDGRYHVVVPIEFQSARGRAIGHVDATLDVEVQDGAYSVGDFESLFVRPVGRGLDEDGTEAAVFPVAPPPPGPPSPEDFDRSRLTVEELSIRTEEAVRSFDGGSGEVQSPTLPLPPPKRFTFTGESHIDPLDLEYTPEVIQARLAALVGAIDTREGGPITTKDGGGAEGMTALGTLKYMGLDGLYHPAWGWRVYARAYFNGSTAFLAKTNVQPNGNWSLSLPPVPAILKVEIDYEPRNIYYTLKNGLGQYYRFSSGVLYTPAPNKVINEYTQAAYLGNSDLVGLGEVHRDGMEFWDQLKTKGEGIDPVPDSSISIYYPNLTYECGIGKPWSCANASGNIWIIPEHATGNVLMHELGHQLQYKYWNGDTPSGSGGSHTWTGCFTKGLALSEGFADFMLVWAKRGQNQDPAAGGFADLEHPEDAGACTTTNKNEMWVAATFWDFYDSLVDGKDTIYYTHTGAAPKRYLSAPGHDSMAEYLSIFKAIVSAQHQTIAGQIFTQNHQ